MIASVWQLRSFRTMKKQTLSTKLGVVFVSLALLATCCMILFPGLIRKALYRAGFPRVPYVVIDGGQRAKDFLATSTFDELVAKARAYADHPHIGQPVRDVLNNADYYRSRLEKGLVGFDGCRIDFIGQSHADDFRSNHYPELIIKSQRCIKDFLDAKRYEAVSAEGFSAEQYGRESLQRDLYFLLTRDRLRKQVMKDMSKVSFEEFASDPKIRDINPFEGERFENDATMRYSFENPGRVIGGEDNNLLDLHHTILEIGAPGPLNEVGMLISRVRLQFAVVKLLDRMRERHAKSGVVVYGSGHMGQFCDLMKSLGVRSVAYNFDGL